MKTRINPQAISPMQLNSLSAQMGMLSSMQKIGKGKRKYSLPLDKGQKKLMSRFINEAKKQFSNVDSNSQYKGVYNFLNYVTESADNKNTKEIKLSYEEYEFLKKMVGDSVKSMENMSFLWYQFIKKLMMKIMHKQYKELYKAFK